MLTRSIKGSLLLAGGLLAVALGLAFATDRAWLPDSAADRGTFVLIGLILAVFGNAMGKRPADAPAPRERSGAMAAARRFFGLVLVLGGLAHAVIWAFAPLEHANTLSMIAVILALLAGAVRVWLARRPA